MRHATYLPFPNGKTTMKNKEDGLVTVVVLGGNL